MADQPKSLPKSKRFRIEENTLSQTEHSPARSNRMVVEYLDASEIRSNPIALRQTSKARIKQFAKHIEAFGLNLPLLIDAAGVILAGEDQFTALKHLGWTEFPAIHVSHRTCNGLVPIT